MMYCVEHMKGISFNILRCYTFRCNCFITRSLRTSANTTRKGGNNYMPLKLAYSSYESTNPSLVSDAMPVIIMHGLLGSKANWNFLSKGIHSKTCRKVIAIDARNHGDSPHSMDLSYHHMAEDVRALMVDLSIPKAAVIGHSMGGKALMLLALKYPSLVEKLIVVDISPVGSSPGMEEISRILEAMRRVRIETNLPLSSARKIADSQLLSDIPDAFVRQFILKNLIEVDGEFRWRLNLDALSRFHRSELAEFPQVSVTFKGPTLFVGGRESNYLKEVQHDDIRQLFPHSEFLYIPGTGHYLHSEKPSEFLDIACKFLDGGGGGTLL